MESTGARHSLRRDGRPGKFTGMLSMTRRQKKGSVETEVEYARWIGSSRLLNTQKLTLLSFDEETDQTFPPSLPRFLLEKERSFSGVGRNEGRERFDDVWRLWRTIEIMVVMALASLAGHLLLSTLSVFFL